MPPLISHVSPHHFGFLIVFADIIFRLVANAIDANFSKGDAIAIDMQMTVNAVIIYLAIVLAGCVVVSIADSFAPKEIATRLRVSNAKGIFTQVFLHI
jgi:acyl-coenzyme A synthetase/AMP-(fatty) acid ligase